MKKFSIIFTGVMFLAFGIASIVDPIFVGSPVEYGLTSPISRIEFRAFYGGMELGLAAFFFYSLRHIRFQAPAILLQILFFVGCLFGRGIGLSIEKEYNSVLIWTALAELFTVVIGIIALIEMRKNLA